MGRGRGGGGGDRGILLPVCDGEKEGRGRKRLSG